MNKQSWIIEYKLPIIILLIGLVLGNGLHLYIEVSSDYQDCSFAKRIAPECIKQECSYFNSLFSPKYYNYMCNLFGTIK